MEDYIESLKNDVQCSLCNETFIEPKILDCFHSFCKLCIKRHAELIDELNVFECPKCSAQTSLKELNSVDDLKACLLHSRIVKVLAFVASEKVCAVSVSHSPASWHCFDCDRSMCDECKKTSHSQFTKDHKAVCLADLKREDLEFMLRREYTCEYHTDKQYKLYCKDCDRCICIKCLETQQCGIHCTIPLQEQTSVRKAAMQQNLKQLEFKLNEMQKQVATLKDMEIITRQSGERAKAKVIENVDQLIAVLQENKRELVQQIEQRIEKAERMRMKGQCVVDQTQGALDYFTKLIEKGLMSDMKAKDIKGCHKSIDFPSKDKSSFGFSPSKELTAVKNAGIGTITVTDHAMSTAEVDSELIALKKAKLIVLTKTSTGELNDDVVDIKVVPEEDVKVDKEYVTTGGKTEMELIPRVAGQLTAEVKVNGNHVSNSPLVMNVKPQQLTTTRQFKMKGVDSQELLAGIAVNKENNRIAVADESSDCVRVFNSGGDLLLTYGSHGSGLGQLSDPDGLAFLNETDVVIADYGNHRICIVNTTTGILVKTFGRHGNGNGEFNGPRGIHVDDDCNIIVSDLSNHRVQVFTKDGDYQYQFSLPEQDSFEPLSTVTHRGLFYVSDQNNHVIHVFEKKGDVTNRISTIEGQDSADGQLCYPWGLAIDSDHNLLVCDYSNDRIQKLTVDGRNVGKNCNEIKSPMYIAVLKDGQLVFTCNSGVFFVN